MASAEYGRYLASREWALLKEQVRERSGNRCERCQWGNHENTHHTTYERIYRELLTDLLAVCRPCHEYLSGKSSYDPAQQEIIEYCTCCYAGDECCKRSEMIWFCVPWLYSGPLDELRAHIPESSPCKIYLIGGDRCHRGCCNIDEIAAGGELDIGECLELAGNEWTYWHSGRLWTRRTHKIHKGDGHEIAAAESPVVIQNNRTD